MSRIAALDVQVEHLKELRSEENKRNMDVLERIWSAINDLKERVTLAQEHERRIQELQRDLQELRNERNKVVGGWITLTAVGATIVIIGKWVSTHWDKIKQTF